MRVQAKSRCTWLVAAALAAAIAALPAQSQDWPARPIRVIQPFAPGGGADGLARLVMDGLSRKFGQQFFIENRPGAAGTLGANIVAQAPPDGYTLLFSGVSSLVVGPIFLGAPFDPMKDFTHIALIGGLLQSLAVHPGFEAKNLRQYVELSRATPEGIAFGSPGFGSHTHLIGELFRTLSGGNLLHVPYKGGGPLSVGLITGQISSAFMTLSASAPMVRAGKLRLLAITGSKRVVDFPEVPTFVEAGYKEMIASTWFSLSGPAGLPQEVVVRLNAEVRAVLAQPKVRDSLGDIGMEQEDLDAGAFTEFVRSEIKRWAPLARAAKSRGAN